MNKATGSKLHFQHRPSQCPRQAVVKLLQMDDAANDLDQIDLEDDDGKYDNFYDGDFNEFVQQDVNESFKNLSSDVF